MWYALLFFVGGVLVFLFGLWVRNEGDKPPGRENVEQIKSGIWTMVFGLVLVLIALGVIISGIREWFSD